MTRRKRSSSQETVADGSRWLEWLGDDPYEELYEERFIAFLDVLGFRNEVTLSHDDPQKFADIFALFDILNNICSSVNYIVREHASIRITSFSDSIVISSDTSLNGFALLLSIIEVLCGFGICIQFPIRGGICVGEIVHSKDRIFGNGLVYAYDMERNIARYPRVIVDRSVIRRFIGQLSENYTARSLIARLIKKDCDGLLFVNFFNHHSFRMANPIYIKKMMSNEKLSPRIREKYQWIHDSARLFMKRDIR